MLKRLLDRLPPAPASYVAALVCRGLLFVNFAGDWLVFLPVFFLFLHCRDACSRLSDEAMQRRYLLLGAGYLMFVGFALVVFPWLAHLALDGDVVARPLLHHVDLLYFVPALIWLVLLDRRNPRLRLGASADSGTDAANADRPRPSAPDSPPP